MLLYSLLSLIGRDKRQIKIMARSNQLFSATFFRKIFIKIHNIHFGGPFLSSLRNVEKPTISTHQAATKRPQTPISRKMLMPSMTIYEFVSHGSTNATSSEAKIAAMQIPSLS
jgi:hypothetical protein